MMNVLKLKGKIVENGYTTEGFAKAINMDHSTLYRKLRREGTSFTVGEANMIVKALGLSSEDAVAIFFAESVA